MQIGNLIEYTFEECISNQVNDTNKGDNKNDRTSQRLFASRFACSQSK